MNEIHDAVREESKPGLWSAGVKLARAGAVALESRTDAELVFRVRGAGRPVPFTVVLYPKDLAWECNCDGRVDPCEHVCAAAISLQQGPVKSVAQRWLRIAYRFVRVPGGLQVHRSLGDAPLDGSASSLANRPGVQLEQCDLAADRLFDRAQRGPLSADRLQSLLTALEPSRAVLLDGAPVAISSEPLLPRAVVEDQGEGVSVTLALEPHELLGAGVALARDTLFRLGDPGVALPSVKVYAPASFAELTAVVLPDLARRFAVEVRTARLPPIDRALEPRIQLQLTQMDAGLSVLPLLVYGAPPHVRIDAGKLVHLRGAVPVRDEAREQQLAHRLREQLDLVPGRRTTVGGPDLARFADKLKTWSDALTGDAGGLLGPSVTLVPRVTVDPFSVQFDIAEAHAPHPGPLAPQGRGSVVDSHAVLRAWSEGLGLVPLSGGGWAQLPAAWLDKHGQRVLELLEAREENGALARHALPQLAALCEALELPPPPELKKLAPLVEGFERIPPAALPADLTATLRPYQQQGVDWLAFLRDAGLGAVLADDMGLGKTLQALCVLPAKSLVVCPTSVLPNWLAELRRFRPALKVCAYHGPDRTLDDGADITVTTYALLRLDAAQLQAKAWAALVLDEAQAIKNPDSQVARAAYALPAAFRVALSGTPIENRLDELWSVMHFTNRGLLGGRRAFSERWAQPVAEGRPGAAAALRQRIRPFVLRRLKRDVAPELPPRTEAVLPVVLDERERDVYRAVYAATRADVVGLLEQGGGVMKALEALLRLRQAACHPALVPGQQAATSSKVNALLDALGTAAADGHKALVFSQWTSMLDLIEPHLNESGIGFVRLDGSTADRGAVTERFQSEGGPPVMLVSLKAGGTGLNLTSADHVFLCDPWWNPAVEAQAADRAHRIGQTRPVTVYRLVSQGTVEEKILALQDQKRALFEAALGDGGAAASLTKDDLLALLDAGQG